MSGIFNKYISQHYMKYIYNYIYIYIYIYTCKCITIYIYIYKLYVLQYICIA